MNKSIAKWSILLFTAANFLGCAKIIKDTIKNNPDIIIEAMKEKPVEFMDALNEAAREAQEKRMEEARVAEQEEMEGQFKNPASPEIDEKRAILGPDDAPITIVEYADFQCGYCSRAHETMKQLFEKEYKGKIRFMYKNLPVTGAPMSLPAAEAFEAIAMIDEAKAYEFHDKIFENQGALRQGGKGYLEKVIKDVVGKDASKVLANAKNDEIQARIAADRSEAQKFNISGTPAFVINGVFLKGAYPIEKFKEIIDRHLEAKK